MSEDKKIMNEHTGPYVDLITQAKKNEKPVQRKIKEQKQKKEREKGILEIELDPDFRFHKCSAIYCHFFITHRLIY